jgi:hypothetical protein
MNRGAQHRGRDNRAPTCDAFDDDAMGDAHRPINLPLDNCLCRTYDNIHQNRHMNHGNCKESQLNHAESGYEY